jgi:type I restriction enzyme S subunit
MDNTLKIPKIRFKGFTDVWEQCKLGGVGKAQSGVGFPDIEQGGKSGIPFFKVSDMNSYGNESEMVAANNYVNEEQIAAHNWKPINNLPAMFFAKVGAAVMMNRKRLCRFPFLLDNNTMAYSLDGNMWDSYFAKALFETLDLTSLVQVGALPSYNAGDVESMQISLPKIEEQKQIGAYFKQLDNLITLHQRKCDKLISLKKSMLEKMFPKNGSLVPEIRFSGFTDVWEQRKLGEILTEQTNKTSDFASNPLYSLTIEKGVTPKTERYERGFLVQKQEELFKIVRPQEFVTNPMNLRFGALGYNNNSYSVSVSGYYDVFSIDSDQCSSFWGAYFKTPTAMKIFDDSATGSLIEKRRVKYSTLTILEFVMPINIEEKRAIGEYFEHLDNLITLHQRELKKLQNLKKSLLEKMFI